MGVYNGERYIRESIESILWQEFRDFEFLIINDGSTDRSREIILSYKAKDPRVRFVDNEHNIGLTQSLNLGILESHGRYIARQDADDVSMRTRLLAQVEVLANNPNVALVSSWCELIDGEGNSFGYVRPPSKKSDILQQFSTRDSPLPHGSVMFRKEPIVKIGGYDERFWFAQDFDLWLRLLENKRNEISIIPQPLYKLRKLPPEKPFKAICQRRYAELSLQQYKMGSRLEFGDVREWVRKRFPQSVNPDSRYVGEYWLFLALTALCNHRRKLVWDYALQAFKCADYLVWLRAIWRIGLSTLPIGVMMKVKNLINRLLSGRALYRNQK